MSREDGGERRIYIFTGETLDLLCLRMPSHGMVRMSDGEFGESRALYEYRVIGCRKRRGRRGPFSGPFHFWTRAHSLLLLASHISSPLLSSSSLLLLDLFPSHTTPSLTCATAILASLPLFYLFLALTTRLLTVALPSPSRRVTCPVWDSVQLRSLSPESRTDHGDPLVVVALQWFS